MGLYTKNLGNLIENDEHQKILSNSKVAIIGVGGVGHHSLMLLAGIGIGVIDLFDNDVVSETNLQRQLIYSYDAIGFKKVFIAQKRAEKLNPFIKVSAYDEYIDEKSISKLSKYDLILDCTDTYESKLLINKYCQANNRPYVYSAAYNVFGQIYTYIPNKTFCLKCLEKVMVSSPRKESTVGTVSMTASLAANFQSINAVKFLINKHDHSKQELFYFNIINNQFKNIKINTRCDDCIKE